MVELVKSSKVFFDNLGLELDVSVRDISIDHAEEFVKILELGSARGMFAFLLGIEEAAVEDMVASLCED
jgi:hypothetical protein